MYLLVTFNQKCQINSVPVAHDCFHLLIMMSFQTWNDFPSSESVFWSHYKSRKNLTQDQIILEATIDLSVSPSP